MDPATEISEFGTGLRAHLGLDGELEQQLEPVEPDPPPVERELEEIDVLALLEAELVERERTVSEREAAFAARNAFAGIDELALARERRRAQTDA